MRLLGEACDEVLAVGKAVDAHCACRSRSSTTARPRRAPVIRRARRVARGDARDVRRASGRLSRSSRRGAALARRVRWPSRRTGRCRVRTREPCSRSSSGAWRRASSRSGASTPRRAGSPAELFARRRHAGGARGAREAAARTRRRWHRDARRSHDHPCRAWSPGDGRRAEPCRPRELAQLALDYRDAPSLAHGLEQAVAERGPHRARRAVGAHRRAGSARRGGARDGSGWPDRPGVRHPGLAARRRARPRRLSAGACSARSTAAGSRTPRSRTACWQRSTPTCRCRSSAIAPRPRPVEKSTHNRHVCRLRAFTRRSLSAADPPGAGVSAAF